MNSMQCNLRRGVALAAVLSVSSVVLLMTMPATAQTKALPIEMDVSGWGLPGAVSEPRVRPDREPSRLRCWQRGVPVIDEVLAEPGAMPTGSTVAGVGLRAVTADGRQLQVNSMGETLCLSTAARQPRTPDPKPAADQ